MREAALDLALDVDRDGVDPVERARMDERDHARLHSTRWASARST